MGLNCSKGLVSIKTLTWGQRTDLLLVWWPWRIRTPHAPTILCFLKKSVPVMGLPANASLTPVSVMREKKVWGKNNKSLIWVKGVTHLPPQSFSCSEDWRVKTKGFMEEGMRTKETKSRIQIFSERYNLSKIVKNERKGVHWTPTLFFPFLRMLCDSVFPWTETTIYCYFHTRPQPGLKNYILCSSKSCFHLIQMLWKKFQ